MKIMMIVAMDEQGIIGHDEKLPWSLSSDLKRFKKLTVADGFNAVVMGRKTYESIGRPLPNRINYIVSNTIKDLDGASIFKSTEDALESAKEICNVNENYDEIVIIGGGYLFRDTLSITNKLVLTNVDCDIEGDVFYPEINLNEWKEIKSENFKKDLDNDYDFVVRTYEKT